MMVGDMMRILVAHYGRPSAYVCRGLLQVRRKQAGVDAVISELVVARTRHLADGSSGVESATGPRCVSLSGLTIALMLVI
jgi:hypothetical protein